MNNIVFDDESKARELEAKAKKIRRDSKAKRQKVYADLLLECFPEVAKMKSSDEVRAYIVAHTFHDADDGAEESSKAPADSPETMDTDTRYQTGPVSPSYPGYGSTANDD